MGGASSKKGKRTRGKSLISEVKGGGASSEEGKTLGKKKGPGVLYLLRGV